MGRYVVYPLMCSKNVGINFLGKGLGTINDQSAKLSSSIIYLML